MAQAAFCEAVPSCASMMRLSCGDVEKFLEQQAGKAFWVVANDAVFFEEIVEDHAESELLKLWNVDCDRFRALPAIALGDFGRNGLAVRDHPIDHALRRVALNSA